VVQLLQDYHLVHLVRMELVMVAQVVEMETFLVVLVELVL
jgi:hypothetical protein